MHALSIVSLARSMRWRPRGTCSDVSKNIGDGISFDSAISQHGLLQTSLSYALRDSTLLLTLTGVDEEVVAVAVSVFVSVYVTVEVTDACR